MFIALQSLFFIYLMYIFTYKCEILISNYHDVICKIDDCKQKTSIEKIITINE